MRFRESIRDAARRFAHRQAEHVGDHPTGIPAGRTALRSIAAILLGWLVAVGGYIVTMVVLALFNREALAPGVQSSNGWLLVALLVEFVCAASGGFVAGVIARRREIAHAVGLALFGLVVSECVLRGRTDPTLVPIWYRIGAYALGVLAPILGGWLRAEQHLLVSRIPGCVVGTADDLRLSAALTVDFFRFPIAAVVSVVTFVLSFYGGMLSAGAMLLAMRKLSGEEPRDDVTAVLISLILGASLLLAFLLSRHTYRKIMLRNTSPMSDKRLE